MIDTFCLYYEGTFSNKYQAMSHPSKYAMVRIIHVKVPGTDNMFYGEQAYNYSLRRPYRQFVVQAFEEEGQLVVKNFNFDKKSHMGFLNLEDIPKGLTYKEDCDTILKYENEIFTGSLSGCKCFVEWQGKTTYCKNQVQLGKDFYNVVDRGYLVDTNEHVWGSKYGQFEFKKVPF